MTVSRRLRRGDRVLVGTGTHNRAISADQKGGTEVVEVAYAYPAGVDKSRRMAGTIVEFTDGYEQVYNTNSDWIMA